MQKSSSFGVTFTARRTTRWSPTHSRRCVSGCARFSQRVCVFLCVCLCLCLCLCLCVCVCVAATMPTDSRSESPTGFGHVLNRASRLVLPSVCACFMIIIPLACCCVPVRGGWVKRQLQSRFTLGQAVVVIMGAFGLLSLIIPPSATYEPQVRARADQAAVRLPTRRRCLCSPSSLSSSSALWLHEVVGAAAGKVWPGKV